MILKRKIFAALSILSALVIKNYAIPSSTTPQSNRIVESNTSNSSFLAITESEPIVTVQDYLDKICNQEPTCHLVDQVPKEYQTLIFRNCMCDKECVTYGDCCLDSKFYNETEQRHNYKTFACSREKVYVKAKCPKSFRFHQIKWKCENWTASADSDDLDSITPVTDVNNRITYANVYCAMCNNKLMNVTSVKQHLMPWNVTVSCSESALKDANKTGAINANDLQSSRIDREVEIEANSSDSEVKFVENPAEEAAKYAKFDPHKKTFTSWYKGTHYECNHVIVKPLDDRYGLRACIPGISTCSSSIPHDKGTANRCESFTFFVFDQISQTAFKNIFCTICNTNKTNMVACPGDILDEKTGGSTLFTTKDKAVGSIDACKIPALKNKFC